MTRRLMFWGSCVVLLLVFACKSGAPGGIPMGPACGGFATTVVVLNGHRYLYIHDPDGTLTLMNLDEKPQPGEDAVPRYMCPCELTVCSEMCTQAAQQVGHAQACLVAPHTVPHTHAAPAPDPAAPSKPATPPQP